jgi:hypothetical protein
MPYRGNPVVGSNPTLSATRTTADSRIREPVFPAASTGLGVTVVSRRAEYVPSGLAPDRHGRSSTDVEQGAGSESAGLEHGTASDSDLRSASM